METSLLACKKAIIEERDKFPKEAPEKDLDPLAQELTNLVSKFAEQLKGFKKEVASHKKWESENQSVACRRPCFCWPLLHLAVGSSL